MSRLLLALLVLASWPVFGQAGTPIDTTDYWPQVPGSVYRYQVKGGNWVAEEVTVGGGVSWGAHSGLAVSEHRLTCAPGRLCGTYYRNYFAREAEGVTRYGSYAEFPSGAVASVFFNIGELWLKDPVVPGVARGGVLGVTFDDVDEWWDQVESTSSLFGTQDYIYRFEARSLETVDTPAGRFTNTIRVYSVVGGYQSERWYAKGVGVVKWTDTDGNVALLTSYYIPATPPVVETATAIEFYHAAFDHYFVSANPDEIRALDTGYFAGWSRTGYTFKVIAANSPTPAGASPVCRFYGDPNAGLDSHFYSASPAECGAVDANFPEWIFESDNVFQVYLPNTQTGACPAGTTPLYRVFNRRSDANHRYTTVPAVVDEMVSKGGVAEGYGPGPYYPVMCVPQ